MTLDYRQNGTELTISLDGRLDSTTAFQLDAAVQEHIDGVTKLTFDFSSVDYLSSAGLRVLLGAQKTMDTQGSMELIHVNESVRDVLALTGMLDILTVLS